MVVTITLPFIYSLLCSNNYSPESASPIPTSCLFAIAHQRLSPQSTSLFPTPTVSTPKGAPHLFPPHRPPHQPPPPHAQTRHKRRPRHVPLQLPHAPPPHSRTLHPRRHHPRHRPHSP